MKVLAVDDHPLILMGLYHALAGEGWQFSQAQTYQEAVSKLAEDVFDVVVVDLRLPRAAGEMDEASVGFELLEYIRQQHPTLPAIVVTSFKWKEDPRYLFFTEQFGAVGYFPKGSHLPLVQGLKTLAQQGTVSLFTDEQWNCIQTFARTRPPLTPREREVVYCLDQRLSHKEIAERLTISISTLKTHLTHIYEKLEVSNEYQALVQARYWGFLETGWLREQ